MRAVVDLLLPPTCPGCAREGEVVCDDCRRTLERRLDEPAGVPIGLALTLPDGLSQHEWCAAFTGVARSAIHALKYDGERRLADALGTLMAERWRRAGVGGELIVAVPVHESRRRERGFDQAALLADVVAERLGLPPLPAIVRRDETTAQHRLGRRQRAQNVRDAFLVPHRSRAGVAGRWVILVDDVATTGATLAGCARALRAAGASAVSALTFARER